MVHTSLRYTCAFVLACALAGSASAQVVENDLRLVADQAGAPPNVMLIFDTSGSMTNVVWHENFNPKVRYDVAAGCNGIAVNAKPNTAGQCPGSGITGDACPDNEDTIDAGVEFRCTKSFFAAAACTNFDALASPAFTGENCRTDTTRIYFILPRVNSQTTIWSTNYVNYVLTQMKNNGGAIPPLIAERRTDGGKRVVADLVRTINPDLATGGYDERVRFGLARYQSSSIGGFVVQPFTNGNRDAVIGTLNGLPASGGTPLSETLVDVARYFTGQLQNLGSYGRYDRTLGGTTVTSPFTNVPPSPLDPSVLCRGNFIILITDGEPTSDDHAHASVAYNATFGSDFDGDGQGIAGGDSLADVAKYLFTRDLIDNTLMPGDQNIITYTIGFSLDVPLLQHAADNGDGTYFAATTGVDELGERLVLAVEEIILRNATFTAAAVPTSRSVFGDGFYTAFFEPRPAGELYRGHLQAYRIDENFDIVGTDGRNALDPQTGEFIEPRTTFFWDAADTLRDPNNVRRVFTTPTPLGDPNAFTAANLTAAEMTVTAADIPSFPTAPAVSIATAEQLADAIVGFVLGQDTFDEDLDNNITELRDTVLGDIFHSNPVVVGPTPINLANEPGYGPIGDPNSFVERFGRREKILYAGANDGMLHGFGAGRFRTGDNPATPTITETAFYDVGDGIERFGYVPGFLVKNLKNLPQDGAKPYFVDGQIIAADAWFPSGGGDVVKTANEWATVLVTGMRNGGAGYLALDVTDPTAGAGQTHGPYPKVLWEFADPNQPLGRSWSRPVITRVKLKAGLATDACGAADGDGAAPLTPNGDCRERWVAIFGGGYLEQGDPSILTMFLTDPNNPAWTAASKSVFIVALDNGQVLAKASFSAADPVLREMKFSFPSEPAVLDINFDGFADLVYIGDTGGQLWKWDISAVGQTSSGTVPLTTWPIGRFFVAPTGSNGHRRSFFYPPTASLSNGVLTVGLGTGERTNLEYRSVVNRDENQYYVIKDTTPTGTGAFTGLPLTLAQLSLLNGLDVDPNPADKGYYLAGNPDEKFVSDSITFGGFVITTSYTPQFTSSDPNGECEAKGLATLYIFAVGNGDGYFPGTGDPNETRRLVVGAGLPTSPSITVAGNLTKVVVQTSDGRVTKTDGPGAGGSPVELIFWRQQL
jgi:hypothetical protein